MVPYWALVTWLELPLAHFSRPTLHLRPRQSRYSFLNQPYFYVPPMGASALIHFPFYYGHFRIVDRFHYIQILTTYSMCWQCPPIHENFTYAPCQPYTQSWRKKSCNYQSQSSEVGHVNVNIYHGNNIQVTPQNYKQFGYQCIVGWSIFWQLWTCKPGPLLNNSHAQITTSKDGKKTLKKNIRCDRTSKQRDRKISL